MVDIASYINNLQIPNHKKCIYFNILNELRENDSIVNIQQSQYSKNIEQLNRMLQTRYNQLQIYQSFNESEKEKIVLIEIDAIKYILTIIEKNIVNNNFTDQKLKDIITDFKNNFVEIDLFSVVKYISEKYNFYDKNRIAKIFYGIK